MRNGNPNYCCCAELVNSFLTDGTDHENAGFGAFSLHRAFFNAVESLSRGFEIMGCGGGAAPRGLSVLRRARTAAG